MIGIIDGIKSIENKLSNANSQYIENISKEGDDYLQISGLLSVSFSNAGEEVTQDILSDNNINPEEMNYTIA